MAVPFNGTDNHPKQQSMKNMALESCWSKLDAVGPSMPVCKHGFKPKAHHIQRQAATVLGMTSRTRQRPVPLAPPCAPAPALASGRTLMMAASARPDLTASAASRGTLGCPAILDPDCQPCSRVSTKGLREVKASTCGDRGWWPQIGKRRFSSCISA
jgi:hypothetical protein